MDVDINTNSPNLVHFNWLKFLLEENFLEDQLKISPDVSRAAYLTSTFLQQAEISLGILRDIRYSENLFAENEAPDNIENRKVTNLKLLAVKTASLVSWSLEYIHKHLPAHHAYALLTSLVKQTTSWEPLTLLTSDPKMNSLSPVATFALSLFCCWSLKFVVDESLPMKPSKAPYVHVSGLFDPCANLPANRESIFKMLQEKERECVAFLEKILVVKSVLADMPTIKCFPVQERDKLDAYDWSQGRSIPSSEIVCQASYSLGCLFFYRRSYLSALQAFEHCQKSLAEVETPTFTNVSCSTVAGYVRACRGVLKVPLDIPAMVQERVKQSLDENDEEGLSSILVNDLEKQEMSLCFRLEVERRVTTDMKGKARCREVSSSNALKGLLEGRLMAHRHVKKLRGEKMIRFVRLCSDVYGRVSEPRQTYLREFLAYTYAKFSEQEDSKSELKGILKNVFRKRELKSLSYRPCMLPSMQRFPHTPLESNDEHALLTSYDPAEVSEILLRLSGIVGKSNLLPYDKLRLFPELMATLESMANKNLGLSVLCNVLISKSNTCERLQMFSRGRDILHYVDKKLGETNSHKLMKQLKWLILDNELLLESESKGSSKQKSSVLVDKARSCVASLKLNRDLRPWNKTLLLSVAHLLNQESWDPEARVSDKNEIVLFGSSVGALFYELKKTKPSPSVAAKFLDSVGQAFSRRPGHLPFTRDCFLSFMPLLTNPTVLSILVSCLVKLLRFSDEDVNWNIFSSHDSLWPLSLSNANFLDGRAVLEALECTLARAVKVDGRNPSWFRTLAELNFSLKRHHISLRHFLYLGFLSSDHFSEPSAWAGAYDDSSYERMIQSCIQIKCHAQAAVLCQFLSTVDYATAFKCLSERPSLDAVDDYYDCIWDGAILEFAIHVHKTNAEMEKLGRAQRMMRSNDLNGNRTAEAHLSVSCSRARRFLRRMAEHYLGTVGLF